MAKMTAKQQLVLSYVQDYFTRFQQSPLIREIQEGCHIMSYKSTLDRLNALERKGLLKRLPNKHRGIQLLQPGIEAAAAAMEVQPVLEPIGEAPAA